jgi:hypothetical protein
MKRRKTRLIAAGILFALSLLFSRISISVDGFGGWILLGISGLLFIFAIISIIL